MVSGLYKYIVFDPIERRPGRSTTSRAIECMGHAVDLPNTDWIAENHWCVPLYYRPRRQDVRVKVLVTGGSGFIGSHVVDRLVAAGHEPRIFDLVPSPYHAPSRSSIWRVTSASRGRPCGASRGCDAVIHLAAVSDVNKVLADPALAEAVNAGGTRAVLEAARLEGIARVVYASTVWVYGNSNGHGPLEEDEPFSLPGHLYTATKLAGEMYCSSFGELYGLETTIARFGIPYGPRARPATVLAAFVAKALADEPITIAGDGTQSRRFVYVEDLAEGVVAALDPVASGRVYNLVGAENTTVREIADTVSRVVRRRPDRPRRGAPRRHPGSRGLRRTRRARTWLEGDDLVRRRCPALPGLVDERKRAPPDLTGRVGAQGDERRPGREERLEDRRERCGGAPPRTG